MSQYNFFRFGRTKISVTTVNNTLEAIDTCINGNKCEYITIANLRTSVFAHNNKLYRDIVNNAYLNTPDGMPLVWCGRLAGKKTIERTCGPDVFIESLKKGEKGYNHFFLGDTQDTLDKLVSKVKDEYGAKIAGAYSPEFVSSYEDYDYKKIASLIKDSGADIIWVALGAPKQDFFSERLSKELDKGAIIGVGAAFRFVLGEYKDPPKAFKKLALTGLFWRVKDHPFQSLIWYIKHFSYLIYFMTVILLNRILKLKIHHE